MKIKSIKKLNNKYKIILEDNKEIITYDEVIIKNNILYKKELNEEIIEEIEKQNNYYETYNNILKLIKNKLRSESEIIEYMNKKEIEKNTQKEILEKLKNTKLINDKIYTHAYIHDKISFTPDGPNKIKKELLTKKIDEQIINEELEKINQEEINEKLEKLIIKKLNSNTKYSNTMLKNRLLNHFINLGYEKENILDIIENNIKIDNEIIKKEYIKLEKKLKNKYSEEELKKNIKQKLYQKGFSIDEINNILN